LRVIRIIVVGGGTSGHINPALNIARYIKNHEKSEILYVGSKHGMEFKMAKYAGINFVSITASGFCRNFRIKSIKKNILAVRDIIFSVIESRRILKNFKPDICLGTGGYVMGAFLHQASMLKIPFAIQEQNAIPGLTTKLLAKRAKFVFLGNEEARAYLKNCRCIVTGNPIRNELFKISNMEAKKILGIDPNTRTPIVLSFGGSLGSETINIVALNLMASKRYIHIHSYGKTNDNFLSRLDKLKVAVNPKNIDVREYIYNMNICMIAADIVICRAGAMTLSELAILNKPAILIPSPNVSENHQFYNALSYVSKFNGIIVKDKDAIFENFVDYVDLILLKMSKVKNKYNSPSVNNACETIYQNLKNLLGKNFYNL